MQVQQSLLELARTNPGTKADKLTLMKAAHAVLPLHGGDLHELADLLASSRPVPLEWCDVLLCQLAITSNTATTQVGPLLDALRDALQHPVTSPLAAQNRAYLLDRIRHLGYRPEWLDTLETL